MQFELLPLVDMDGILSEDERKRIIKRLHSALSWIGSIIPEEEVIDGKYVNLKEIIMDLISKPELTREDLMKAKVLAKKIAERERYLEEVIIHGDITEEKALRVLEEARGLLRAIEELRNIQERGKAKDAKNLLLSKVDDEKRWQRFLSMIK
ncbi:MAG: hypothetical protein JSV56_07955 [Methanomassiliicoccales archaeon]|nr:MAG: hypothetical protein JSV56_07955 [Methanomassiliicoccales archaeon]